MAPSSTLPEPEAEGSATPHSPDESRPTDTGLKCPSSVGEYAHGHSLVVPPSEVASLNRLFVLVRVPLPEIFSTLIPGTDPAMPFPQNLRLEQRRILDSGKTWSQRGNRRIPSPRVYGGGRKSSFLVGHPGRGGSLAGRKRRPGRVRGRRRAPEPSRPVRRAHPRGCRGRLCLPAYLPAGASGRGARAGRTARRAPRA